MARIKISLGIIAAIIIFCTSGLFILKHETLEVIENIDKTKALADAGKTGEALTAADTMIKDWNKFHTYASIFVNNNKISDAQNSISRIKPLIESEDDELGAEFESAKAALNWIIESETVRWTNIF